MSDPDSLSPNYEAVQLRAARHANLAEIRTLDCRNLAQWTVRDKLGQSPMHLLAQAKDAGPAIRMLGSAYPSLLEIEDNKGLTPFQSALAAGNAEALEALVDLLNSDKLPISSHNAEWWVVLCIASQCGNAELLRKWLARSGHSDWLIYSHEGTLQLRHYLSSQTLLHAAVEEDHVEAVDALLHAGHVLDAHDLLRNTALHTLCHRISQRGSSNARQAILKLLLRAGASLLAHDASELNALEILELGDAIKLAVDTRQWALQDQEAKLFHTFGRHVVSGEVHLELELKAHSALPYIIASVGLESYLVAWTDPISKHIHRSSVQGPAPRACRSIDRLILEQIIQPSVQERYPGIWHRKRPDDIHILECSNDAIAAWTEDDLVFLLYRDAAEGRTLVTPLYDWRTRSVCDSIREHKAILSQRFETPLNLVEKQFSAYFDGFNGIQLEFQSSKQNYCVHISDLRIETRGLSLHSVKSTIRDAHSYQRRLDAVERLKTKHRIKRLIAADTDELWHHFEKDDRIDYIYTAKDRCIHWQDTETGLVLSEVWDPTHKLPNKYSATMALSNTTNSVIWNKQRLTTPDGSKIHLSWHPARASYALTQRHPIYFGQRDTVWIKAPGAYEVQDGLRRLSALREASQIAETVLANGRHHVNWFLQRTPCSSDLNGGAKQAIALTLSEDRKGFHLYFLDRDTQDLNCLPLLNLQDLPVQINRLNSTPQASQ